MQCGGEERTERKGRRRKPAVGGGRLSPPGTTSRDKSYGRGATGGAIGGRRSAGVAGGAVLPSMRSLRLIVTFHVVKNASDKWVLPLVSRIDGLENRPQWLFPDGRRGRFGLRAPRQPRLLAPSNRRPGGRPAGQAAGMLRP